MFENIDTDLGDEVQERIKELYGVDRTYQIEHDLIFTYQA